MDYKLFQKAIADRLGSQFGLSVLISFVFINWELIFKMADLGLSIDNKIDMIKLWDFRLGWFITDIFIIILIFQLGNLIAKTAGTYINQVLWGKILAAIGNKAQYVDRDIHEMALKDRDEFKDMRDKYSADLSTLKNEIGSKKAQLIDVQRTLKQTQDDVAHLKQYKESTQLSIDLSLEAIKNFEEAISILIRRNAQRTAELDNYFNSAIDALTRSTMLFSERGETLKEFLKVFYFQDA